MKVIVYSARPYDQPVLQEAASGKHELLFTDKPLNMDTAESAAGCAAVALFTSDDASARVLEKLSALGIRYVALRSVGYDHVDLAAASSLGIRVANVPEYSPYSVAEHAVSLLMALNRKIVEGQTLIQMQDFRLDTLKGFDVHGKTVGVIGTGKIGMAFARIMHGFGVTLLAHDPVQKDQAHALEMRYVPLNELLQASDIVSLHCPLTPQTRHLLGTSQLAIMKRGAILINTSRGAVVSTDALINALQTGDLGGACLDVYENEKGIFFNDHRSDILRDEKFIRLRSFRNVLISGHQAFLTQQAIEAIASVTVSNLDAWQHSKTCANELVRQNSMAHANPGIHATS